MPIPDKDKPLDQLRQEVIDQLVLNYGHGKISKDAFERRLDEAYDTDDNDKLSSLSADLESFSDPVIEEKLDHFLYASEEQAEQSDWIINIFSGTNREYEEVVPASIKIINIFGGSDIDYSLALFSDQEIQIKVINIFGGANIYVPEGVKVKNRVIPLFGGVSDKSEPGLDPYSPVITISGLNLFGGIDIGLKRTFKERMQSVAESIKEMLS